MSDRHIIINLARPRGFCAGVERAIEIVERALKRYGSPVYVRHEIVHNRAVVDDLKQKGAVFVEEIDHLKKGSVVVFSAHGVSRQVQQKAADLGLISIDASCPLVIKIHSTVIRHARNNTRVILIGHKGHPEVIGTMGQLAKGEVILVENRSDIKKLDIPAGTSLAYTTQTTLSKWESRDIIEALRERFPDIKGPDKGGLCYATTNRQLAVRKLAEESELILVIGSPNSSNSNRLKETAHDCGRTAYLIDTVQDIDRLWFKGISTIGITSGASAPEYLVQEVIEYLKKHFKKVETRTIKTLDENIHFPLPEELK